MADGQILSGFIQCYKDVNSDEEPLLDRHWSIYQPIDPNESSRDNVGPFSFMLHKRIPYV